MNQIKEIAISVSASDSLFFTMLVLIKLIELHPFSE